MPAGKALVIMANREGKNGHPRLVPLCSVKLCDVCILVRMEAEGEVYEILIQLINDSPVSLSCKN